MGYFFQLNDSSFKNEVLQSKIPVLVEFGAEWCGPCRQLEPILEELFVEWEGKIRLGKLDIDRCVETTLQYQVMSVPTLILFINGEARQRVSGKQPKERLEEKFQPFIEEWDTPA